MEDKILGFQFVLVSAKPTHPSYNDGSDQDEPQKQPSKLFCKKAHIETLLNSLSNTCIRVSFLENVIKKEALAQVFYSEFGEISKNTFFTKHI